MSRKSPEATIHRTVVQHLRMRGVSGLVFFHVPNGSLLGGKRNRKGVPIQASIFNALGVRAGVSDLILLHAEKFYCLELKAPGGRPTEHQLKFISDADRAGAFTAMPEGLDAALATLEAWGLLRGQAA